MNTLKNILMSDNAVSTLREMDRCGTLRDLEPTLADLRMPMPAGNVHKDNLTHSIQVLENSIARETDGPDLILRTAALFHDIGKPATRKFNGRKSVTFDAHEAVGASITRKVLNSHNYTKSEISEISKIVALHMRSHGFGDGDWTDSAVRRLITDAGSDRIMDRLIIVFYADATTSNINKLNKHHKAVDALSNAVTNVRTKDARKSLRPAVNGNEVMAMLNIGPGPELGKIMKFLNSDEGIHLSRDEAIDYIMKAGE